MLKSNQVRVMHMALALPILALYTQLLGHKEIHWAPDIAAARKNIDRYKVPVLIHFYGDNCLPTKLLEQNVLNRTEVVDTLNKYFICVKVNASQEHQYGSTACIVGLPTCSSAPMVRHSIGGAANKLPPRI
ncbi:MAG: hypothetical protein R3C56_35495 [Pirellulaceae bacterium]